MKFLGWILLLIGLILMWPILGPLLTVVLILLGLAVALALGALLVGFGWVVALVLLLLGIFVATLKWALPIGIVLLGLWLISLDQRRNQV